MNSTGAAQRAAFWGAIIPAAAILMITMGGRQTWGMFLSPLNTATGLGVVSISLAMAVGQFVWGLSQPIFGAAADRWGAVPIVMLGGVLMAAGTALTPWMHSELGLVLVLGVLSAAGAGAGSFSILIGASAQRLAPDQRSFGAGLLNAGGSVGQFVFAPITERVIALAGWVNALYMLAASALLTVPIAWFLRTPRRASGAETIQTVAPAHAPASPAADGSAVSLREQLAIALPDRSYLLLNAGFFTCGFHIAFLMTHLPTEIGLCGLPAAVSGITIALIGLANIAGSLIAGALGSRYRMKYLLFWLYTARAVIVLAYLAAPKTQLTFYVFAIAIGLTFLATVPPTAGLVGKLFGVRYLATLFGLTLLSHQIGGFLGAWLGGVALARNGDYHGMFVADAVLALLAGLVNLPIREARLAPRIAAAPA